MTTATPTKCDRRGKDLTLYFNTGTAATPVWVQHLGMVNDLNWSEVEDDEQLETRNSSRFVKEYLEGDIDFAITGTQLVDEDYEGYLFLYAMRVGGDSKDVMILTNTIDVDGAVGWRGSMRNKDRSVSGPASGGMTATVNLKPAACGETAVTPVKVASSVPGVWDPTYYTVPV